jgi:hypothetical protein
MARFSKACKHGEEYHKSFTFSDGNVIELCSFKKDGLFDCPHGDEQRRAVLCGTKFRPDPAATPEARELRCGITSSLFAGLIAEAEPDQIEAAEKQAEKDATAREIAMFEEGLSDQNDEAAEEMMEEDL